jgi:Zn-dependent M16 (insulinase) family peptidase
MSAIQDISILPTVTLGDIDPLVERFEYKEKIINKTPVWFTEQETNGIVYLNIKFNIDDLPPVFHHYLEVFCLIFPFLGSKTVSLKEMERL